MDFITCVFLKSPEGEVKTRLAQSVSQNTARQIYKACVEDILANLRSLNLALYYNPPGALAGLQEWLGEAYNYYPQGDGDLGAKMLQCFRECFAMGYEKAIIIGSDIPQIGVHNIADIAKKLDGNSVVLSPGSDGGYGAIGMQKSAMQAGLFNDVAWSTPSVLEQTVANAHRFDLHVALTETLDDIDYLDDLQNFCNFARMHQPGSKTLQFCIAQRLFP